MSREEIKESLIGIFEDELKMKFDKDTFFETPLTNMNINSVAFIKLLVRLEVFYDVEFQEDIVLINNETTVNDMVTFIMNKQQ